MFSEFSNKKNSKHFVFFIQYILLNIGSWHEPFVLPVNFDDMFDGTFYETMNIECISIGLVITCVAQ